MGMSTHATRRPLTRIVAMRLAGEAVADGDVRAIARLLKVLDRLDRYQPVVKPTKSKRRDLARTTRNNKV